MIRPLFVPAEQAAGRMHASFCDKATFFRERKFHLRAGCYKTNARAAKDFRRDPQPEFARRVFPAALEEGALRNEVHLQAAKTREKTAQQNSQKRQEKRLR